MADNNIKKNIAKNLVRYRNTAGLTQSELAEKINYSDKSVSKWERAEGTPDIFVLYELSKIYGVRVDDFLISDEDKLPEIKNFSLIKRKRLLINLLSVGLVWLVAVTVYFLVKIILGLIGTENSRCWIAFIFAVPISGIVQTVFSEIWWKKFVSLISVSVIIWGTVLSVFITMGQFGASVDGGSAIFLIAAVLQVLAVLWYILRRIKYKQKNANKINIKDNENDSL